ncbi:hypothetical protein BGW80DRAFT_1442342 [Lactifluus volemus]|nr:hypothetical protein BGW80DRAFT_1442342 [Lactifluus volemus]
MRADTAQTGQHWATNATSRRTLAHTAQKRNEYGTFYSSARWTFYSDHLTQWDTPQVGNIGPREVARINAIFFQPSFRTPMWQTHPRTQAEEGGEYARNSAKVGTSRDLVDNEGRTTER